MVPAVVLPERIEEVVARAVLRKLEVKCAEIDANSPTQMLALSTMCENEEKRVRRAEPLYQVGWAQRTLANFFTLPGWEPVPEIDELI